MRQCPPAVSGGVPTRLIVFRYPVGWKRALSLSRTHPGNASLLIMQKFPRGAWDLSPETNAGMDHSNL